MFAFFVLLVTLLSERVVLDLNKHFTEFATRVPWCAIGPWFIAPKCTVLRYIGPSSNRTPRWIGRSIELQTQRNGSEKDIADIKGGDYLAGFALDSKLLVALRLQMQVVADGQFMSSLMNCSSCGFESSEGVKFCSECGTALYRSCAQCGADSAPSAKFCGDCGASLNTAVETPVTETRNVREREVAGERRHLTVLFCDLVGSTEISAQLDPEEWREIEADYHHAAAEAITHFGGYVAKYLGDGIMAYFGWPEAHDNNAERAARAGLAIVDAVGALNLRDGQRSRPKLSVRIGIDTGHVVIGEGGGGASEVFGDAANIAARVQSASDPDAVIVTPAVNRLVSGLFVVEERGAHQLKGIAEPVDLYQIMRLSSVRNRLAASMVHGLTPFVGRDDETRFLWSRWERASDGQGQVVLISGEAGIGKSRLVRQFRKQLAETPHLWLECAGSPYFQNTPFYPIADMLQQGFAQRGDGSDPAKLSELERDLVRAGLKLAEAVPLIAPMLNLSVDEKYPPLMLSPEQQRKRLLTTLAAWFFGAGQSVAMAVEDLHWFDASSLELMQLLIEQAATARVMLVCTARPEFRAPWSLRTHHAQFTLNRLSTTHVRELVASVVAHSALSVETIEKVVERTGGVPLFVEELTRAVLEKGGATHALHEIPANLHDSLMARLDRLGPAKEVAQIASVIGREFSYELLLAVSAIPADDLQAALLKLADAELIYTTGIPPTANYTFKHALIQDAAYGALLKSKRKQVHGRVARVLEMQSGRSTETQPEILAHHYSEAGNVALAISYWHKAGQRASQGSASNEAVAHLSRGLELIERSPDTPERSGIELALLTTLGPVLIATKGYAAPEVGEVYDRARELCRRVENSPQLPIVIFGLFAFYVVRADHEKALALGKDLLSLAERAQDRALLVQAHNALGLVLFFRGDFAAARDRLEQSLALYDVEQHRSLAFSYAGQDPGVTSTVFSAWISQTAGYPEQALKRSHDALDLAQLLAHPYSLVYARGIAAAFHQYRKEEDSTRDLADASLSLATEHGFPFWSGFQTILLGWALVKQGKADEGIAQMSRGMEAYWATGAELLRPYLLGLFAEALVEGGSTERGLRLVAEALEAVKKTEERFYEAELYRKKGELLFRSYGEGSELIDSAEPRSCEIERCFLTAISVASRQQAKWFELLAATSLARLWQRQGRKEKAQMVLSNAYSWFTEGFDTVDMKDAKLLLDLLNE
jgi:class 3 adenylate cyclase/predicted ATPase